MRRWIVGFHQDEDGDWVAELSCFHNQHIRHRPPFQERPRVLDETERAARVGAELDCPLCDRAELPDGLRLARTAGPFDADTLPFALRKQHRVAERTWGRLRVDGGSVWFSLDGNPPLHLRVDAGHQQPIPPGMEHSLTIEGPVRLVVEFLVRDEAEAPEES